MLCQAGRRVCRHLQADDPIELLKSAMKFQIKLLQQSLTLSKVSVGVARSDWPVQPSVITKKMEEDMEEKMRWAEAEKGGP